MTPRRIVAIGASTIYGSVDTQGGGFVQRLRIWQQQLSPKNFVYELGIYGESLASLAQRIDSEAGARSPHLIIIYPGLNDIRRVGSASASPVFSDNENEVKLEEIIKKATTIAPTIVITAFSFDESKTTPFPNSDWFYTRDDAARLTSSLRKLSAKHGAHLLDLAALWSDSEVSELLANDGLHCNEAGHQKLFLEVKDFIASL